MRTVSPGEQTVLESTVREYAQKVEVEDAAGSYQDLSAYLKGFRVEVDVDAPVREATVRFIRASGATKLSPLIANTLDRSRGIKVYGSTTAYGDAPNYKLVFGGIITRIAWASDPLVVTARGTPGARLAERWVKRATVYGSGAGEPIEDVITEIVSDWSDESINVFTPGFAMRSYEELPNKSVWQAIMDVASLIGGTVRERFNPSSGAFEAYFEQPNRNPSSTVWTFPASQILGVRRLDLDRDPLRNYIEVLGPDESVLAEAKDTASIADDGELYAAFRQGSGSSIDTAGEAQTLADAALSDLSELPAFAEVKVPWFWPAEVDDPYTFGALADLFNSSQDLAVTGFTHEFPDDPKSMPCTYLRLRGKPQGQYRNWHKKGKPGQDPFADLPDESLTTVREIARTESQVTFGVEYGARVTEDWLYGTTAAAVKPQPISSDPWPAEDALPDDVLVPGTDTQFVVGVPGPGRVRYVEVRPVLAGTGVVFGQRVRIPVYPTGEDPDRIVSLKVLVDDDDGSVVGHVTADSRAGSYRFAYAVGTDPAEPSDADVEAGTVQTISGTDTFTLPAGTVPHLQMIRVRACAYVGADGTGVEGSAADHGPIVAAEDIRLKPPVSLKVTTADDSDPDLGLAGVTPEDPGGFLTSLVSQTKTGDGDWSAETTEAAPPSDGVEYTEQVTKVEGHPSSIRFIGRGMFHGESFEIPVEVNGFDKGKIPDPKLVPYLDEDTQTASCSVLGDVDTKSVRIAASTSGEPSDATVRAATPIDGRTLLPTDIGTLVSGLVPGDIVYFAAFGYSENSGGGFESSTKVTAQAVFLPIAPSLELTTFDEDNLSAGNLRVGVTVKDEGGQAEDLYIKERSGVATFPTSWTLKTGTPADATEYLEDTPLANPPHGTQQVWRLTYKLHGDLREATLPSPVGDIGVTPNALALVAHVDGALNVSAICRVDFDTESIKIAASTGGEPSLATVRGETAINRPAGEYVYTPDDIGTLLTANPSDTVDLCVLPYSGSGGGGTEGEAFRLRLTLGEDVGPWVEVDVTVAATQVTVAATAGAPNSTALVQFRDPGGSATGGAMTASDATLTVSGGDAFALHDVNKRIVVPGAGSGGADLVSRILSVTSETEVELVDAPSTTVSGKTVTWGDAWSGDLDYDSVAESSESGTRIRPEVGLADTWIEVRAKISGASIYSTPERIPVPAQVRPAFNSFTAVAFDDGTDIDYQCSWTLNEACSDGSHDVYLIAGQEGSATVEANGSEASPVTNTSKTITDSGAGDGVGGPTDTTRHWIIAELRDSSGNVLDSRQKRYLLEAA